MSVTAFALSAPLEDGVYSKEENIFKIEANHLGPPPGFSCNFKALLGSLEMAVFLLQGSQERGWEIYQTEETPGTNYCLGSHENIVISKEMVSERTPAPFRVSERTPASYFHSSASACYPEGQRAW